MALGRKEETGFTLIELLIVVAILAILAASAVFIYRSYFSTAFQVEPVAALLAVRSAQEDYYMENDKYASRIEMLSGFNDGTSDGTFVLHNDKDSRRKFNLSVVCNPNCNVGYVASVENFPDDPKYKAKWNLSCSAGGTYDSCKPEQVKGSSSVLDRIF